MATEPQVVRHVAQLRQVLAGLSASTRGLALVPTMGFLHEGHVSLMREGARRAPLVAVSLFVNPAQFGPKEDLSRYPRDFEGDLAQCAQAGVQVVYAPEVQEVYPEGYQTTVEVSEVSSGLCGERRPGHFRGVATVVTQLLCLFRPQWALFGEKDFQQLQVIRALNRDLQLGVEIVGMPTVREKDGLALSSRNAYLSAQEREQALGLSRGIQAAQALFDQGVREAPLLLAAARAELSARQLREDYVALVDPVHLRTLARINEGQEARLLVAAFAGNTRLIDNARVGG